MGRLLILLLIVFTIYMLWRAFGPGSQARRLERGQRAAQKQVPKGPDDDPDFLWNVRKEQFKQQRAAEEAAREREQRERLRREREAREKRERGKSGENDAE